MSELVLGSKEKYRLLILAGALLPQDSIVEARHAADDGAGEHALPPAIYGRVDARDGDRVDPPPKSDPLLVDHVRDDRLGNAERQRVDDELVGSPSAGCRVRGRQVKVEAKEGGNNDAGKGPEQRRVPERACEEQEHVRDLHRVVRSADSLDRGDGECVAVGQDLLAQVVQLERTDAEHDRSHRGQGVARVVCGLLNSGILVQGHDALPQGDGALVDDAGNIGWRGG